jgi:hypothetical protein
MRRLCAAVFFGITLLSVAIAFAIAINRRSDWWLLNLLSTNPDGTPCAEWCLFGAQPDWMTYTQVQNQLLTHPLLQGLHVESRPNTYDYFFGQTVDVNHMPGLVSVSFHQPDQCTDDRPWCHAHINNRLLKYLSVNLPLEAIIQHFGIPDFIEQGTDLGRPFISLYYRNIHLSFSYTLGQEAIIRPTESIASIDLYSTDAFEEFTHNQINIPWPGFGLIPPATTVTN